jgi:hypothetical protein
MMGIARSLIPAAAHTGLREHLTQNLLEGSRPGVDPVWR